MKRSEWWNALPGLIALAAAVVSCGLVGRVLSSEPSAASSNSAARPTELVRPAPEVNPKAVVWRTPQPPTNPEAGDVWVNPQDDMEMVYVASGEFLLGSSDAQIDAWIEGHPQDKRERFADEQPQSRVRLAGYWIGRAEVTNAQYLRFVQATGHPAPEHWKSGQAPPGLENFPVVYVAWQDASAYCEWAGGRLPRELEWEKAARGADGRLFPWGNRWDSKRCRNFELVTGREYATAEKSTQALSVWLASHDGVREGPAAVGSYPAGASPYGCVDMAGNVWEWCGDWYEKGAYARYASGNLAARTSGRWKVLRGGSWHAAHLPLYFRCAYRGYSPCCSHPDNHDDDYGFRCARAAAPN